MKVDEKLWAERQYEILVSFVHCLAYHRILLKAYNDSCEQSEFWTRTINSHIIIAIINWCMVFGNNSNELHWKKVVVDKKYQACFLRHLLEVQKLSNEKWKSCWKNMVDFRNNYAAHRNSSYPPVPIMDIALMVVFAYDQWFRNKMSATFDEPLLKERFDRLIRSSSESLRDAVARGPKLIQEYEGMVPTLACD